MSERAQQIEEELELLEQRRQENLNVSGVSGFAEGLVSSVIPDALRFAAYDEEKAEYEKARRRETKVSRSLGSATGLLGGMMTGVGVGGVIGATSKGITGKLGTNILGRTVAGAAEGTGISLTEATAESALDKAAGMPGGAAQLASAAGLGAAIGGGASFGFYGLGKTANFLFRKLPFSKGKIAQYQKGLDKREAAHKVKIGLQEEAQQILETTSPQQLLQQRIMGDGVGARFNQLVGKAGLEKNPHNITLQRLAFLDETITKTPLGPQRQALLQARQQLTEDLSSPDHIAKLQKFHANAIKEYGDDSLFAAARKEMGDSDQMIKGVLDVTADKAASDLRYGINQLLVDATLFTLAGPGAVATRLILRPFLHTLGQSILGGIAKNPTARQLITSSLSQGRLATSKKIWSDTAGGFISPPGPYTKYFAAASDVASSIKIPPITLLTHAEYDQVRGEIQNYNEAEMELAIRAAVASKGMPQDAATPIVQQYSRMVSHLRQTIPQTVGGQWVAETGEKRGVPQSTLLSISRTLRATMIPASVLHDFTYGTLTREAVKAWWATQPEAAEVVAKELDRLVRQALQHGRKFTRREQKNIAMLMDPSGTKLGRLNDINMVQSLQATYAEEEQASPPAQVGGPGPKGNPSAFQGMFQNTLDANQTLGQRANKRR